MTSISRRLVGALLLLAFPSLQSRGVGSIHLKKLCSVALSLSLFLHSSPPSYSDELPSVLSAVAASPSTEDIRTVQLAFRDFDLKNLDDADKEFSISINKWKSMQRPRDEIVSLIKARANVRLDNKHFDAALADYNEALQLMSYDGEKENGLGRYPEYPDTFVGRALTKEGLADWEGALEDYNKAISLWGGGRGEGVNPFVLTYRGNVLGRLGRFADAVPDYQAASDRFNSLRDVARYSDAGANMALALYEAGRPEESIKTMKDVLRKNKGYADMHVALAADAWSNGNYIDALKEWQFTCEEIDVGCEAYKDPSWVSTIRRWPPSLALKLRQFLDRQVPDKLKGVAGDRLAPNIRQ